MIYLDYSASTPTSEEVLSAFLNASHLVGNANSKHILGQLCKQMIDEVSNNVLKLLNLNSEYDVVYTSGSSESNNLAIKGLVEKQGIKHIITTAFEHPSVIATLSKIQKLGCKIDILNTDDNGIIDINQLVSLITDEPTLVSIVSVNSEIGILQPIKQIAQALQPFSQVVFHCDATQSIGKVNIDFAGVDLITFSAHKFYGIKGIGALLKKQDVQITPIINGGSSTTKYRSGTPAHPLIKSLESALELAQNNLEINYQKVLKINQYFKKQLTIFPNALINSNEYAIPHIINVSFLGYPSSEMVQLLAKHDICVSSLTACALNDEYSQAVLSLTNDLARASSSIRISLSHLTSKTEIDELIQVLKEVIA